MSYITTSETHDAMSEYFEPETIADFTAPVVTINKISEDSVASLIETRKLSREAIENFKLGTAENGDLVLPSFDTAQKIVDARFFTAVGAPSEQKHKNGLKILFGSNLVKTNEPLVIFFSEFDALAAASSGIQNATAAADTDFIRNQWTWLRGSKKIILVPQETTSKDLITRMKIRLGAGKVFVTKAEDLQGMGNVSRLFYKYGSEAVARLIANAERKEDPDFEYFLDGEDERPTPGIPTGWALIDKKTGGLKPEQLVIIGGDSGDGKTTTMLNLISRVMKKGKNIFYHSVEGSSTDLRNGLFRIIAGPAHLDGYVDEETQRDYHYATKSAATSIRKQFRTQLVNLNNKKFQKANLEMFFLKSQYAVDRFGAEVIVIDNLMGFTRLERGSSGYYGKQSDVVELLTAFAEKNKVIVILLAHNKKRDKSVQPTMDDIEGSSQIANWASLILQIWKVPKNVRRVDADLADADGVLSVVKGRGFGNETDMRLLFCPKSRRQAGLQESERFYDLMGWETDEDIEKIELAKASFLAARVTDSTPARFDDRDSYLPVKARAAGEEVSPFG